MPKTKTQSNDQRPPAKQNPRAGRRPTAVTTQARESRVLASLAPEKPTRRVKQKGPGRAVEVAVPAGTATPSHPPRSTSKQAAVITLLCCPEGTDLATLMAATGWQSHSVRAFLSGLRKQGHHLHRDAGPNGSIYRIVEKAGDAEG